MGEIILCDCYDCKKETNQDVLFSHNREDEIDDSGSKVEEKFEYYLVKCRGCDYVSFLLIERTFLKGKEIDCYKESFPDDYRDNNTNEAGYNFLDDEEIALLPPIIRNLYNEVVIAFYTEIPILTGIGLRTLLEAICIHQDIKAKNLEKKIDILFSKGLVAAKDLPVLHDLRLIGNITVHQVKKPNQKTLDYSLEILNHTLKSLYIIPTVHAKLKR